MRKQRVTAMWTIILLVAAVLVVIAANATATDADAAIAERGTTECVYQCGDTATTAGITQCVYLCGKSTLD